MCYHAIIVNKEYGLETRVKEHIIISSKIKNVDSGCKKWFDLLQYTTYKWFWDVYTSNINLTTLNDEEIVMLDDIFGIVTFIHPRAVQNLLKNPAMLRKFIFIREKAKIRSPWVETRHHLLYLALLWLPNPSEQLSQLRFHCEQQHS